MIKNKHQMNQLKNKMVSLYKNVFEQIYHHETIRLIKEKDKISHEDKKLLLENAKILLPEYEQKEDYETCLILKNFIKSNDNV